MRKFAIFAAFFSAAVFLRMYLLPADFSPFLPALFACLAAGICLFLKKRSRLFPTAALILLGFASGLCWCRLWDACILHSSGQLASGISTVEAQVLEYPRESAYGWSVELRLDLARCRLYYDDALPLEPGDRIRFPARFSFTKDKSGSDYLLSQGVQLFAYPEGEILQLGQGRMAWRFLPLKLARRIQMQIPLIFGDRAAAFLSALLTDDRSLLQEDVHLYAMLRESGIAHCVAVSGMHLSFLVLFLYVLLGQSRLSALVCIPVILGFMAMTGFSASVIRAGIMQLAICLAKLTRREYDSLTALTLALLVLLLLNPYAAMSAGLQLSFSATLGIILFSDRIRKGIVTALQPKALPKVPGRLLSEGASALSVSLAALICSTPVTAAVFGRISLLSPLTNLLTLWAVALAFGFGMIASLLGLIWLPAARLLAIPARLATAYISGTAGLIGSLPFASASTDSVHLLLWLLLCYLLLPLFLRLPGLQHRMRGYFCAVLISLPAFLGFHAIAGNLGDLNCSTLDVGQGQCFVVTGEHCSVVVDCGGSLSTNAGDAAANHLFSLGRLRADALILTHYHSDHANGALELLRRMPVELLCVPPPQTPEDAALLQEARELGVRIVTVSEETVSMEFGGLQLQLVPPLSAAGENEAGLCILGTMDSFDFLLTGDADSETELRLMERLPLPNLELLIVGHHGSASSSSQRLLDAAAPDVAVISAGRNSYGLPADAALRRLSAAGADIYRTDENGTVLIRYQRGKQHG